MSYVIKCDPCYFDGTLNVSGPHLVSPEYSTTPIVIETEREADTLASMLNDHGDGPYLLAHGQYAAPQYKVLKSLKPVTHNLKRAMFVLNLHYDFEVDGSRTEIAPHEMDFAARDREFRA